MEQKKYYVSYRYENSAEITLGLTNGITPIEIANRVIREVFKLNNVKATKIKEDEIDDFRTVIGVKSYSQGNHMNYYTLRYQIL